MAIVRQSKKRNAILRLLQSTDCHPSADWVYQQLRPVYPDLSLGTVYRNLGQLAEQRMVKRVGVVNGQERYDAAIHPHAHFVCNRCGVIIDLPDNSPEQSYMDSVCEQYGFVAEDHEFYIRGLCKDCKEN